MKITKETGQNKVGGDGKTQMNDMQVDWFKFQEALGRTGHMGIVDIDGSPTHKTMAAETTQGWFSRNKFSASLIGLGVILMFFKNRQ